MALHFLVENSSDAAVGDLVSLTGAEAKHAAVVRRLRVGEAITCLLYTSPSPRD